jgi:Holliday junction resolvase RusA-like endonuclease
VVPGEPQPWERAGLAPFIKDGKARVHVYTPKRTDEYETRVAHFARLALRQTPAWIDVALAPGARFRIHLHFVTTNERADLDNCKKAVLDGIKRASTYRLELPRLVRGKLTKPRKIFLYGVYSDDVKVDEALVSICRNPSGAEPRTEVTLEPATDKLEVPLWMQLAMEAGWAPHGMQVGGVT